MWRSYRLRFKLNTLYEEGEYVYVQVMPESAMTTKDNTNLLKFAVHDIKTVRSSPKTRVLSGNTSFWNKFKQNRKYE